MASQGRPASRFIVFSLYVPSSLTNLPHGSHLRFAASHSDSGHGGQTRDLDGDEVDGYDEGK